MNRGRWVLVALLAFLVVASVAVFLGRAWLLPSAAEKATKESALQVYVQGFVKTSSMCCEGTSDRPSQTDYYYGPSQADIKAAIVLPRDARIEPPLIEDKGSSLFQEIGHVGFSGVGGGKCFAVVSRLSQRVVVDNYDLNAQQAAAVLDGKGTVVSIGVGCYFEKR